MSVKLLLFSFFSFFVLAAFPVAATAAPQILGLVATATPLPMTCDDGTCSVEVSGVCLQEHRPAPASGTEYRAAGGSHLTLQVQGRDGILHSVPVADQLNIKSKRLFNSVLVSLPEATIKHWAGDGFEASLSVGPLVTLVPVPDSQDPNPITEEEIADLSGPLRQVAESAIHGDTEILGTTQWLNQMVNRLPSDASPVPGGLDAVRDQSMGATTAAQNPKVLQRVNGVLDACREILRVDLSPNLRSCLSNQHDILNAETTQKVWRSLRPNS